MQASILVPHDTAEPHLGGLIVTQLLTEEENYEAFLTKAHSFVEVLERPPTKASVEAMGVLLEQMRQHHLAMVAAMAKGVAA